MLDLAENNAIVALLSSSIRLRAVTIEVLAKVLGVSVIYVDGMERCVLEATVLTTSVDLTPSSHSGCRLAHGRVSSSFAGWSAFKEA